MAALMLYLTIEPQNGAGPVTIAQTANPEAIAVAARQVLAESRHRVDEMRREDPVLGILQAEEARRLERALGLLLPELQFEFAAVQ